MSNSTTLMSVAFFVIFVFMMISGINTSLVNLDSISNPLCTSSNIYVNNLKTQPVFLTSNLSIQTEDCVSPFPQGNVLSIPFYIPFFIVCTISNGVVMLVNFVIAIINAVLMVGSYSFNFVGMLFSPCSIIQDNPTLYAIVFIPLTIVVIYIVAQAIKPTGGGG